MSRRSATLECSDCQETFTVSSQHPETVMYCPFCSGSIAVPIDDVDDELSRDDFEESEEGD